ncbi:MAG TPA: ScyD/ScyE family protein [Puia sp.]|nr:ScyD/ScyE family protein [Puia sp.]
MKSITKALALAGLILTMITSSCKRDLVDNSLSVQKNGLAKTKSVHPSLKQQLVAGLGGGLGSTVGPDGDLYVPDDPAGAILRIDPQTGDYTTFASGLPKLIPEVGIGGITDVAFLHEKPYALVTLVDDPTFPTGQVNGIYRIDGPNSFTVIADIGAFNLANPPTGFPIDVLTGVLFAMQPYLGGFLVTDGHFNRVLFVTLDGHITIIRKFTDIVPTGMDVRGSRIYLSQAGPIPHLPENGKVLSFSPFSPEVKTVGSGAPLLVDVEFGRGHSLFALSQGPGSGAPEGSPAVPNSGKLVRVNANGTFTTIADSVDRPTSLEIIGNTAYIITLLGEIWTVDNIADPPFGHHRRHLLHHHN